MHGPLRVAVLGTGFVGRQHLEALSRLGATTQVCALATADIEQGKRLGSEFGIDKIVSSYSFLLDDRSLDAVHVCTPNSLHFSMVQDALLAGKHVLCEKPLATSAEEAQKLTELAWEKGLRNCTGYNLRFYPLVQQMRSMCQEGDLGEILVVQGTYSQDWLLFETDWNWRVDSRENGPSRAMADIGSHWCDMAEYVTGRRISSLCADLQTFHKKRFRPKGFVETFSGKTLVPADYQEVPVDTEDFGAVIFRMGERTRGSFTASQVAAGRKNYLSIEIYGTKSSVIWDAESPTQLWIGNRNANNQILVKDPTLMKQYASYYAELPGGHVEGYNSTFKHLFRQFYRSIADGHSQPEYPQFSDGLRQLTIVEAELASNRCHAWVEV
jgi:predicted dehydrogenase